VDVPEQCTKKKRCAHGITGVDLGITAAATLSSGEKIPGPRPLKAALRRLKIRGRRVSRKVEAAKVQAKISGAIPTGVYLLQSNNRKKAALVLAKLHARVSNIRNDFLHKLTTRLCRENQAVGVEDLHVRGMLANDRLARSISDMGMGEFRRQIEYKALRYDTLVVVADRWYPSSKLLSCCKIRLAKLPLSQRVIICPSCGKHHDRDVNASVNLEDLAVVALYAKSALPVANCVVTHSAVAEMVSVAVGKVTPVRNYEAGHRRASGQEKNRAHKSARF
jgi:putative transposase